MRRLRSAFGWLFLAAAAPTLTAAPQDRNAGAPPVGLPIVLHPDGTWSPVESGEDRAREAELTAAALDAIEAGRIAEARELLGRILVERELREGRALVEAGEPADGLLAIDRALAIEPDDPAALELRARGLLALGERMIADGAGGVFVDGAFNDALRAYLKLGRTLAGRLGAARAAYMLNQSDDALRYARDASALLDRDADAAPAQFVPERVIADATYLAYADAATAAMTGEREALGREAALFPEAQGAVDELIATVPQDPATWQLAANLLLFRSSARGDVEAQADALAVLERGLERLPDARGLLDSAAATARGLEGGAANAVAFLERFLAANPDSAYARQLLAIERFDLGMQRFPGPDEEPETYERAVEGFRAAEADFEAVAASGGEGVLDAERLLSWRIVCRNAIGWVRYWQGELEAARDAFLATEELHPRGLEWEYPGQLRSGVSGLEFVVAAYVDAELLVEAAAVADILHARLPEDPNLANNAGFLNRDAALALASVAERYCRAAQGGLVDPRLFEGLRASLGPEAAELEGEALSAALAARANEFAARARATMVKSGEAYLVAARLSPEDVRVVNDTALVYVYYLHTDLERSEQQLLRAVELGERQLAAGGLDEQELYELKNAWGDAHENLGVLALEHRGDLDAAETWFRRAAEIGPDPRPIVDEYWLAQIAARRAGEPAPPSMLDWVSDCE